MPFERETFGGAQDGKSGDATGTGGGEERVDERDPMGGHARHLQQNGAHGDEKQKRRHHQNRRTEMVFAQRAAGLGQFDQYYDKEIELYENQVDVLEVLCINHVKMENVDGDKL